MGKHFLRKRHDENKTDSEENTLPRGAEKSKRDRDDNTPYGVPGRKRKYKIEKTKFKKEVYHGPICKIIGPFHTQKNQSEMDTKNCYNLDKSSGIAFCRICGKEYKTHNRILKHMWEHHDSWKDATRFCRTKHQKVQTLETAQFLAILRKNAKRAPHTNT
ncbi:MAG: uncharacterized protein A8A55_0822 [Amphiamblys sp. WSBS2006]|nr:MAG: uncharacterized protein A8A55_0822 [Amphiamblys sp. WSBS2006]